MNWRRTILGIAIFTAQHFAALALFAWLYIKLGGSRFGTGRAAALVEGIVRETAMILAFPTHPLARLVGVPAELARLAVFGGSLVWGTVLYFGFTELQRLIRVRRVSLRYILAFVTLVAVVLGLVSYAIG